MTWLQWIITFIFVLIVGAILKPRKADGGLVSRLKSRKKILISIPLLLFLFSCVLYVTTPIPLKVTIPVQAKDALKEGYEPIENATVYLSYEKPQIGENTPVMSVGRTNKLGNAHITVSTAKREKLYIGIHKKGYYSEFVTIYVKPPVWMVWKWMPNQMPGELARSLPPTRIVF